jgi:hypothetical protein
VFWGSGLGSLHVEVCYPDISPPDCTLTVLPHPFLSYPISPTMNVRLRPCNTVTDRLYWIPYSDPDSRAARITVSCAFPNHFTVEGSASWRIPLGVQLVPGIVLAIGCIFLPPSPRLLVAQGRNDEALQTLAKLRLRSEHEVQDDPLLQVRSSAFYHPPNSPPCHISGSCAFALLCCCHSPSLHLLYCLGHCRLFGFMLYCWPGFSPMCFLLVSFVAG